MRATEKFSSARVTAYLPPLSLPAPSASTSSAAAMSADAASSAATCALLQYCGDPAASHDARGFAWAESIGSTVAAEALPLTLPKIAVAHGGRVKDVLVG